MLRQDCTSLRHRNLLRHLCVKLLRFERQSRKSLQREEVEVGSEAGVSTFFSSLVRPNDPNASNVAFRFISGRVSSCLWVQDLNMVDPSDKCGRCVE